MPKQSISLTEKECKDLIRIILPYLEHQDFPMFHHGAYDKDGGRHSDAMYVIQFGGLDTKDKMQVTIWKAGFQLWLNGKPQPASTEAFKAYEFLKPKFNISKRPSKYQPLKEVNAFIKKLKKGDLFEMRTVEIGYFCIFERKEKQGKNYRIFYRNKRRFENGESRINKVSSHRIISMKRLLYEKPSN